VAGRRDSALRKGEKNMDDAPLFETWLKEIKSGPDSARIGMYLMHNGVVRRTARDGSPVTGMDLSYDKARLASISREIETRPGVVALRVWINEGHLAVGDDIMRVLVGGDIRENVFGALQEMVRLVKTECVKEREIG
jgi:molybdopterin synthase catalytic subunit